MKAVSLCFIPVLLMAGEVPTKRLVSSQDDPANWLMYGRNYGAWRCSPFDEINAGNISRLTPQWMFPAAAASPNKSGVASVKREIRSLMPETYGTTLTSAELNDLLAYLASLGRAEVRK
jgi:glucose dehydrogenase